MDYPFRRSKEMDLGDQTHTLAVQESHGLIFGTVRANIMEPDARCVLTPSQTLTKTGERETTVDQRHFLDSPDEKHPLPRPHTSLPSLALNLIL